MLTYLAIDNVVLIRKLALECFSGLTVLTGETGAGKSILLDALALATGKRSEARLVRKGEDRASVSASFDLPDAHPGYKLLKDNDITPEDALILKRVISSDGRSKAFINNQPVSVSFLQELGDTLVEVHGQFETQGLLNPKTHRGILDAYAGIDVGAIGQAWQSWQTARQERIAAEKEVDDNENEKEYLRNSIEDLEKLAPERGEETTLSERKTFLMNTDAILQAFQQVEHEIAQEKGAEDKVNLACRALERVSDKAGERVIAVIEKLDLAIGNLRDAVSEIESMASDMNADGASLEEVDDRLYAIKTQARKHECFPDDLPEKLEELKEKYQRMLNSDSYLGDVLKKEKEARAAYIAIAQKASEQRISAAKKFSKEVNAELPPLKLEKAKIFVTVVAQDDEEIWTAAGLDQVSFTISTNPGQDPGPLNKIASGGELSRFMLAFKVVMADTGVVPTLIFDEIDSGVGGSTAAAIGERLARLSQSKQILVVTHSPQVAASAGHHWVISKASTQEGITETSVKQLDDKIIRQEEIARMLAGAKVTEEARAAADRLLETAKSFGEAA